MPTHSLLDQAARMLLRVDGVVQATRKEKQQEPGPPPEEMAEA
jgi:T-complex protein 1 subunit gamma